MRRLTVSGSSRMSSHTTLPAEAQGTVCLLPRSREPPVLATQPGNRAGYALAQHRAFRAAERCRDVIVILVHDRSANHHWTRRAAGTETVVHVHECQIAQSARGLVLRADAVRMQRRRHVVPTGTELQRR